MAEPQIETVILAQGQCCHVEVGAGATIWVRRGRLALRSPQRWWGEFYPGDEAVLDPEQTWVVRQGGCIQFTAQSPVQFLLIPA